MVIARERPINTFPRQETRDTTIENFWKRCFLLEPPRSYIASTNEATYTVHVHLIVENMRWLRPWGFVKE